MNTLDFETLQNELNVFTAVAAGHGKGKIENQRFGQYLMNKYDGLPDVFYIEDAFEVYNILFTNMVEQNESYQR